MARLTFKIPMKIGTQVGNLYDASNISSNSIVAREMVFDDATTELGSHNIVILDNSANVFRFAPIDDSADSTNRTWSSDKINNEIAAALTGGISNGTVINSTLRWSGTDWVEIPTFKVDTGGNLDTTGGTITNTVGNLTLDGKYTVVVGGTVATSVKIQKNLTLTTGSVVTESNASLVLTPHGTGVVVISPDATFTTGNIKTAQNVALTLAPQGTGKVFVTPDATFSANAYIAGGTLGTPAGALAISPVTTLTLSPTTNLTLDPAGSLFIADDMTFSTAAAERKIINTGGNLTLDATAAGGHVFMNKDTTVTGVFQVSSTGTIKGALDVDGIITAGSSGVSLTNSNGYILPAAIVGSEYQLVQVAAAGTTFTATTTLDCGTF